MVWSLYAVNTCYDALYSNTNRKCTIMGMHTKKFCERAMCSMEPNFL